MSGQVRTNWDPEAAKTALSLLRPNKRMEVESQFSEVIEEIRDALQRKVPRKAIRLALRDAGLRLAPTKLNELIERSTGHQRAASSSPRRLKTVTLKSQPEAVSDVPANQPADAGASQ